MTKQSIDLRNATIRLSRKTMVAAMQHAKSRGKNLSDQEYIDGFRISSHK